MMSYDFGDEPSSTDPDAMEDQQSTMARSEWYDYASRFVPIENTLASYATNPQEITNQQAQNVATTDQAFNQQAGSQQRQLAGLGVAATQSQQAAMSRDTNLSKGLAEVQTANTTRDDVNANQLSILS